MVIMARQQCVGQRTQADKTASDRPAWQEERQDAAGDDKVGHRRAAAVEEGWGIGHGAKIVASEARCYLSRPHLSRAQSAG
jgi:hypothetical protein